jgi:uncharacterized membrane protein YkvI
MLPRRRIFKLRAKPRATFFEGSFGRLVLPGIILQSVLIGGGFATGREIVEYGAKYGALGWLGGVGIFLGFSVMAILTFELARVSAAYDYRTLLRALIGRGWILYEVMYGGLAILIIAVMASAMGEILGSTLGTNYWIGVLVITVAVGLLNFHGQRLIERFKTYGTLALFSAYALFGTLVISSTWQQARAVLASGDTSFMAGNVSMGMVLGSGVLYVGYNLAVYPAALFTLKRQRSRKESVISGLVAGVLMTAPWFLTYVSILGFYPSRRVLGAPVPWLEMLAGSGHWVVAVFGVVVAWTLIETATGMIHAFIERLNVAAVERTGRRLARSQNAGIAVITLVLALILARIGIIDLIARGYSLMAYGMIAVYALPLLTIGLYRIWRARPSSSIRAS